LLEDTNCIAYEVVTCEIISKLLPAFVDVHPCGKLPEIIPTCSVSLK